MSRADYRTLGQRLVERAGGRCERCGSRHPPLDRDHVKKRSAGGEDSPENLVMLCRGCHEMKDAPYVAGRLLVAPLGGGRFCFRVVRAENKWATKVELVHDHTPTMAWQTALGGPVVPAGLNACPFPLTARRVFGQDAM